MGRLLLSEDSLIRSSYRLALSLREPSGARMRWVRRVEIVNDGMDHDGLAGDGQGGVGGDCYPVV